MAKDHDSAGHSAGAVRQKYAQNHATTARSQEESSSQYPKPIARALKDLQSWAKDVSKVKCRKCRKAELMDNFDIDTHFSKWMATRKSKETFHVSSIRCAACRAETCIGCEEKPCPGVYAAARNDLKFDWCCSRGGVFALWVVLCTSDKEELEMQSQAESTVAASRATMPSKGTGYGTGYDMGFSVFPQRTLNFREAGDRTDSMTQNMVSLAVELLPKDNKKAYPAFCAMIQLSLLQDKIGSLLRNDSLRNIAPRGNLYWAVFAYVEKLGQHPDMESLVCDERYPRKRSGGLLALSIGDRSDAGSKRSITNCPLVLCHAEEGMNPSLVDCMAKLVTQSRSLLSAAQGASSEFQTRSGKDLLSVAKRVQSVHRPLAKKRHDYGQRSKTADSWQMFYEQNCVEFVPNMLLLMRNDLAAQARAMHASRPDRVRRIATEVAEMSTGLPPNIFVKTDEARPDCIKALIVGPNGTPYEGGLFEFDILCGPQYPDAAPNVQFRTTGGGIAHFNPNLYQNGKVCLSLLGTWHGGSADETWIAGKSTILSVLVSIQAMILCEYPIENEPAWYGQAYTSKSWALNRKLQALTVRYAVLDWLRVANMRDGLWREVVKEFFNTNGDAVLATARRWAENNPAMTDFVPPSRNEFSIISDVSGSGGILGSVGTLSGRSKTGKDLVSELKDALGSRKGKGKT